MTLHDETSERPSPFDRLFGFDDTLGADGNRGAARGRARPGGRAPIAGSRSWWTLALVQLSLGALSVLCARAPWPGQSALAGLSFEFWILLAHVLSCTLWALALRRQMTAVTSTAEDCALLATLSHELRAPLNGIQGMSSLLSRTTLDGCQSELVATLRGCADNLLVLVNDALDFARLEVGRLPIVSVPFEPRAVVDEVLALNGPSAQEKELELFAVVESAVAERVVGDPTRLRQTLTNLVTNAVKFTARGEVEVRVTARDTGVLAFSVRDTGIGIPPAARGRLFEPFVQADDTIGRDYGGSGLGLAICRRLVRAMGGTIDFESTPGIGSRFLFELPLPQAAEERPRTPKSAHAHSPSSEPASEPAQEVLIVVSHDGTREAVSELCAWLDLPHRVGADLASLERPFLAAFVDDSLSSQELDALARHPRATRIFLLARSDTRVPCPPLNTLSWPVRQAGLSAALRRVAGQERPDATPDPPFSRGIAQARILVVEDGAVNRTVAEALLTKLGASVRMARDGAEALTLLHETPFDLVLMDCQLPILHGFEVTRALRAQPGPNRRTPVIALTGEVGPELELACRQAGMDGYLEKPIQPTELMRKLDQWLSAREPAEASDLLELETFLRAFEGQVGSAAASLLAATYRDSVPEAAHALTETARQREFELDRLALAQQAHALRGAARSMGLLSLASTLAELEGACGSGEPALLQRLSAHVETRLLQVSDALLGSPVEPSASSSHELTRVPKNEAVG